MIVLSFPAQIAFAMFGVYVMIDEKNVLDAQKIFVSMALINILKTPLSQLPFAMSTTMQVTLSFRHHQLEFPSIYQCERDFHSQESTFINYGQTSHQHA